MEREDGSKIKYHFVKVIGVGGCGVVSLYEDPLTKHILAAKCEPACLNPSKLQSIIEKKYLAMLSQLDTPYFPKLYGTSIY
jgi:hypothetical protein